LVLDATAVSAGASFFVGVGGLGSGCDFSHPRIKQKVATTIVATTKAEVYFFMGKVHL
jgi:hypothetical protein